MRKIDFLSQSPSNLIFQKETNNTTFGGVLTLIYLIVALIIFFAYLANSIFSPAYEFTYYVPHEVNINGENRQKFFESEKYNPTLNFKFSLLDGANRNISDNFILYDGITKQQILRDEVIERRVNDILIYVLYKCKEGQTNCKIDSSDLSSFYQLKLYYQGFNIYPIFKEPIYKLESGVFHKMVFTFNSEIKLAKSCRWIVKRCEDTKGLSQFFDYFKEQEEEDLKEKDIFVGGTIEPLSSDIIHSGSMLPGFGGHILLLQFYLNGLRYSNTFLYEDYKRKENSFWNSIPNIFSLWLSLYNGFKFVFAKLYSKNFDNYKIMESILSKQKEKLQINKKKINEINIMKDFNMEDNLIDNKYSENEKNEKNDNIDEDDNKGNFSDKKIGEERILPKRAFFDFVFNTLYFKRCCKIEKQQLILACNDIIQKYYSFENILYNQIMIENLWKDYKWNNYQMKSILNNNSFMRIKELLKN